MNAPSIVQVTYLLGIGYLKYVTEYGILNYLRSPVNLDILLDVIRNENFFVNI